MKKGKGKKKMRKNRIAAIAVAAGAAAVIIGTAAKTYANTKTFMKGSSIGSVNVEKMTAAQAGRKLSEAFAKKSVILKTPSGSETIRLSEIADYDGSAAAAKAMSRQNSSLANILPVSGGRKYSDDGFRISTSALRKKITAMKFMKSTDAPKNAYVKYADGKVTVVPEHNGTQYIADRTVAFVRQAIKNGQTEIGLNSRSIMKNPSVTSESEQISIQKMALDRINGHAITLDDGKTKVVLDSPRYMKYVRCDRNGKITVDDRWLSGYAASLASNFGTVGKPVTFTGADGKKITAAGGTYGKTVNVTAEKKQLLEDILSGSNVTRKPNMKTMGNDTLGRTYILVNIAEQKVIGYKDGKKVVESSVVTGKNDDPERRTHRGAYYIFYRKSPAVLKGPGYASPVHYFMAFSGGQGFHDADGWRSAYGGSIYLHSGSHGCVNMPLSAVRRLWVFGIGTPVIVI